MVTTAAPILVKLSARLNEKTVDLTAQRMSFFNDAVRQVISLYKWPWARKLYTLTPTLNVSLYDLTTLIPDYNIQWGLHAPERSNKPIPSSDYGSRTAFTSALFSLTPDNKSLYLTAGAIPGTVDIWYYQTHTDIIDTGATLNIPIPEDVVEAIVLYMKYLVHDSKRQRYDARNALLDFKEKIDSLRPQAASNKAKNMPKTVPNVLAYYGVSRRYRY